MLPVNQGVKNIDRSAKKEIALPGHQSLERTKEARIVFGLLVSLKRSYGQV